MFELITTFYHEQNTDRRNEFLHALKLNAENTQIQKVYILCESGEEFIRNFSLKIEIVKFENRPKFKDLILFANTLSNTVIKIIANTDIYFDETLSKALHVKEKEVYCLTRWNHEDDGQIQFFPNFKSQDSWIFRDTLPDKIGDFFLGVPGCDNRLAAEFIANGFKINNPSLSIHSIHLHATEKRTYHKVLDRVPGEYAYCLPTYLAGDILTVNLEKLYLLLRRKYYNAIFNKNLEGVEISFFDRFKSLFYLNYFKLRLKLI
jgi:hypothetical protein